MRRVTLKDLEAIVLRINRITQSPESTYTKTADGRLKANIGNFHLSGAYGGWTLHRICSAGGGVDDILRCGYVSKRELQRLLSAYVDGLTYEGGES